MPSYPRTHQLKNSLLYHVFSRSANRITIFNQEEDYRHFLGLLKNYQIKFKLKIYHWVIMPNHYHLLLEINEPVEISKFLAGLSRAYTHYHHKNYSTSGFLWQGRFKLQPIQKERYLTACARYIECNPVRADIVAKAEDYCHSSAQFYCCGLNDGITVEDPLFLQFGNERAQRKAAYCKFLSVLDGQEEKLFIDTETPCGSKEFLKKLVKEKGRYLPRRRGRSGKK